MNAGLLKWKVALVAFILCNTKPVGAEKYNLSPYDLNSPIGWATTEQMPTGGEGGEVIVVENERALRSALAKKTPAIIYLKGEILLSDNLSLTDRKNLTIIGLPGSSLYNPNLTSDGGGLVVKRCRNLILRNITFRSAGAYDIEAPDNLSLITCQQVWVDHCDFQDGMDGNFDISKASDNIAVTWCRFRYLIPPHAGGPGGGEEVGGSDDHRLSNLIGSSDNDLADSTHLRVTYQFCWWDEGCRGRMPFVRYGRVHLVNCYYNPKNTSSAVAISLQKHASLLVEGCDFNGVKRTWNHTSNYPWRVVFNDCLEQTFPLEGDFGEEPSFVPPYRLPAIDVSLVEKVVTDSLCGAGATLNVSLEGGVADDVPPIEDDCRLAELTINDSLISVGNGNITDYEVEIPYGEGVYAIEILPVQAGAKVSQVDLPTALPATLEFTVTSLSGIVKEYRIRLVEIPMIVCEWNFGQMSEETLDLLANDTLGWKPSQNGRRYSNLMAVGDRMMAGGKEIKEFRGLRFSDIKSMGVNIDNFGSYMGNRLMLCAQGQQVIIPDCRKNEEIVVDFNTSNSQGALRGWILIGAEPEVGALTAVRTTQIFTVKSDGDVVLQTTSGLHVYRITRRRTTSTGWETDRHVPLCSEEKELVSCEYYDLAGRKLTGADRGRGGITFVRKCYTDGSVKVFKLLE